MFRVTGFSNISRNVGTRVSIHAEARWRVAVITSRRRSDARAMADLLLATTVLENKAGEKVPAGEALQGKVVALYVRHAPS